MCEGRRAQTGEGERERGDKAKKFLLERPGTKDETWAKCARMRRALQRAFLFSPGNLSSCSVIATLFLCACAPLIREKKKSGEVLGVGVGRVNICTAWETKKKKDIKIREKKKEHRFSVSEMKKSSCVEEKSLKETRKNKQAAFVVGVQGSDGEAVLLVDRARNSHFSRPGEQKRKLQKKNTKNKGTRIVSARGGAFINAD